MGEYVADDAIQSRHQQQQPQHNHHQMPPRQSSMRSHNSASSINSSSTNNNNNNTNNNTNNNSRPHHQRPNYHHPQHRSRNTSGGNSRRNPNNGGKNGSSNNWSSSQSNRNQRNPYNNINGMTNGMTNGNGSNNTGSYHHNHHHGSHIHHNQAHQFHQNQIQRLDPQIAQQQAVLLEQTLQERGCCTDLQNDTKRAKALEALEQIVCQWVTDLKVSKKQQEEQGEDTATNSSPTTEDDSQEEEQHHPQPALVTFGSYRLGVHRTDSDLDVLALCPNLCTRGDFFTSLVDQLIAHPSCQDVHPISTAFTPVIKFMLNDIPIDLLFGRLQDSTKLVEFENKCNAIRAMKNASLLSNISNKPVVLTEQAQNSHADDLQSAKGGSTTTKGGASNANQAQHLSAFQTHQYSIDDSDVQGMDEPGVRSLNGARVSQMLLEMVPNKESYRIVLRAVKEWANVQGIYSNVLGFLGGINFAIMAAWICMSYPADLSPTELLLLFFRTFATWKWPEALSLGPIQFNPPPEVPPMPVWNPEANPRDRHHLMPIITPAYPSMNSSYNVGIPQLRRVQDEMVRATICLQQGYDKWRKLFFKSNFFRQHSNFLQITIKATNSTAFKKWFRFCESRLRLLITSLETEQINAWPFTKFFHKKSGQNDSNDDSKTGDDNESNGSSNGTADQESLFFIALRFAPNVESINLRYCISDFSHKVDSWHEREEGMDLVATHVLQKDLPKWIYSCMEGDSPHRIPKNPHSGNMMLYKNHANKNSNRPATKKRHPHTPVSDSTGRSKNFNSTGLTPKMAQSFVDEGDELGSPKKRLKLAASPMPGTNKHNKN